MDQTKKNWACTGAAVALAAAVVLMSNYSLAGTDTTFDSLYNQMLGYYQGSGGKLAAILGLGFATIYSLQSFNFGRFLNAIGIGAVIGLGPGIVTAGVTAMV